MGFGVGKKMYEAGRLLLSLFFQSCSNLYIKKRILISDHDLKIQIEQIEESFEEVKKFNYFGADDNELLQERVSASIIHFFINDVLSESAKKINEYLVADGLAIFKENEYQVDELIVEFSPNGKKLCDYLEKIISKKVINSAEVSLFDSNGAAII